MNDNPFSSAFLTLRRASERLAKDEIGKTASWLEDRKTTIKPSIRTLRCPLQDRESAAHLGDPPTREVLAALKFAIEHGDRRTKEAAETLAYGLIGRIMMARLLDPKRGSIPRFVRRIEKSVESFEEKFH